MSNEFEFAPPNIDRDAFEETVERPPIITYQGRITGERKFGFFASDQSEFDHQPIGWESYDMHYGPNPTAAAVPVFMTYRMRAVVVAVRRRWIIETPDGRTVSSYWYEKRENRPSGKKTGHIQVMLRLPDDETFRVLGLRGMTRTVCWDNDPDGAFGMDNFPRGVEQVLSGYAKKATEALKADGYNGPPIPSFCSFWTDFMPSVVESVDGTREADIVQVGQSGIVMNPFIASMVIGEGSGGNGQPPLTTRYVGAEMFDYLQSWRKEVGQDWENEWRATEEIGPESGDPFGDPDPDPVTYEEDEIPF